ncbi:LPXTG cell wall anchor domain-containing protein [Streptomyces sp. NPDC048231]|uniref:LPXTG cell wall anchor domain-containing protein n=1 Tax=Streptomyces sp. NPDC048231 TaxID=3365519 RepID=UPI00370FEAA8
MTTSPKWRVALASAASAAVLVATPLTGAPAAHAQPPTQCATYPPVARLTLSDTVMSPGSRLTFRGTCFRPRETVVAEIHSRGVVLGRYRADSQGVVRGRVTIPRRTDRGTHVFELEGRRSHLRLTAVIRVINRGRDGRGWHHDGRGRPGNRMGLAGSAQSLAKTGDEKALGLGGAAAGMIAVGGGTLLVMRRRRNS